MAVWLGEVQVVGSNLPGHGHELKSVTKEVFGKLVILIHDW